MVSPYFTKFSVAGALVAALAFLLFPACRFWQNSSADPSKETPHAARELQSEIPFSTKEPEVFQAEMAISANNIERRTFIARNGANRRYDYDFGTKNEKTVLLTDKSYLIFPQKKIYAESTAAENFSASDDWQEFITVEWLDSNARMKFDKLETVGGLTRYRISASEKNLSEILISVDETLGLPVKQEFYSLDGEQKILTFVVELKNLKLQAEEDLFIVPKDFKKVSLDELSRIWRASEN